MAENHFSLVPEDDMGQPNPAALGPWAYLAARGRATASGGRWRFSYIYIYQLEDNLVIIKKYFLF